MSSDLAATAPSPSIAPGGALGYVLRRIEQEKLNPAAYYLAEFESSIGLEEPTR